MVVWVAFQIEYGTSVLAFHLQQTETIRQQ